MRFLSPNGVYITGELVTVPGVAQAEHFEADGTPEYDDRGTELFWDDSKDRTRGGKKLYLDENGDEWTWDQCTPDEDEEDEEDEEDDEEEADEDATDEDIANDQFIYREA